MVTYNLSNKEKKYFEVAKAVAKTSDFHSVHIGCVIVYKHSILSVACNSEKTHSLQYQYNKYRDFDTSMSLPKVHAEVHAISKVRNKNINWKWSELYVYREYKNGRPALSKPCEACQRLINDLGIKTIFYIDKRGNLVKEKL